MQCYGQRAHQWRACREIRLSSTLHLLRSESFARRIPASDSKAGSKPEAIRSCLILHFISCIESSWRLVLYINLIQLLSFISPRNLYSCKLPRHITRQGSHLAALGGYFLPSDSTWGSQSHRSDSGMASMTLGIWLPQPHQVVLSWSVLAFQPLGTVNQYVLQEVQVAFMHILVCLGTVRYGEW